MTLRDQLRQTFEASGLSMAELARRAGTSHSRISNVLAGKSDTTLDKAQHWLDIMAAAQRSSNKR